MASFRTSVLVPSNNVPQKISMTENKMTMLEQDDPSAEKHFHWPQHMKNIESNKYRHLFPQLLNEEMELYRGEIASLGQGLLGG